MYVFLKAISVGDWLLVTAGTRGRQGDAKTFSLDFDHPAHRKISQQSAKTLKYLLEDLRKQQHNHRGADHSSRNQSHGRLRSAQHPHPKIEVESHLSRRGRRALSPGSEFTPKGCVMRCHTRSLGRLSYAP